MRLALSLLLALASCTLLWGTLLPPRNVRLEAQNFHVFLHWDPDLSLPDGATYEVEWKRWRRTPRWTRAEGCWEDSTNSSWGCELHFDKIHDIYWARVRVVARGKVSNWTHSSPLQPYRDTIVGPPKLHWLLQDDILSVHVIMPLTPFRRKNGSYKPVNQVLRKLWYLLSLYEGDVLVQQIPCKQSSEDAPCTFKHLKPSMQYCIRTVAMGMAREQSREAEQCMETPAAAPGFSGVLLVVPIGIFLSLSIIGLCFVRLYLFSSPRETQLPKALAVLSRELTVPTRAPTLELKEDVLTLPLPPIIPSCGSPVAEQTISTVPLLLSKSLSQDTSGYCANGFGQDCCKDRDPSCAHSLLDSWTSSRLEEVGEVCDGDDVLEQPMLVRLTRDSYTGDREYQISKVWFPPHLQLYTKCQCSAQRAGSCLSLPASGRSFSQGDLQDSLGVAGHGVALSSVKLPASEEEHDEEELVPGAQHGCGTEPQPGDSMVQQNSLELAAPGTPCQLPQLPPNILQAFAFSGYELRPRADGDP